jgi:hypothetical protein
MKACEKERKVIESRMLELLMLGWGEQFSGNGKAVMRQGVGGWGKWERSLEMWSRTQVVCMLSVWFYGC